MPVNKSPNLVQIIRMNQEVIRPAQIGHPLVMRTVQGTVLTDNQFVIAHPPKAINKLIDIGDPIERMKDKRQPRSVSIFYR